MKSLEECVNVSVVAIIATSVLAGVAAPSGAIGSIALSTTPETLSIIDDRLRDMLGLWAAGFYAEAESEACRLLDAHQLDNYNVGYVYCIRGHARAFIKNYNGALSDITQGLALNSKIPNRAELYLVQATCLIEMGNLGAALKFVDQSLALRVGSSAYLKRARIFIQMKNFESAKIDIERAAQWNDCRAEIEELNSSLTLLKRDSSANHRLRTK